MAAQYLFFKLMTFIFRVQIQVGGAITENFSSCPCNGKKGRNTAWKEVTKGRRKEKSEVEERWEDRQRKKGKNKQTKNSHCARLYLIRKKKITQTLRQEISEGGDQHFHPIYSQPQCVGMRQTFDLLYKSSCLFGKLQE